MDVFACMPCDIGAYKPPEKCRRDKCELCGTEIWVPVPDDSWNDAVDWYNVKLWCALCCVNKHAKGELDPSEISVFTTVGRDWESAERQFYIASTAIHDQQMAWAETNLPEICRAANNLIQSMPPGDPNARLVFDTLKLFVNEIMLRRRSAMDEGEEDQLLSKWPLGEAAEIMKFTLHQYRDES